MFRNASAAIVASSIKPPGMNFFVFARRTAKTTRRNVMIMFARFRANVCSKIPGMAVKIKMAADTADMINEILLFALKNPINPPASSRTM